MTTIIPLLLIAGVLTLGSGCAKPDWIEQTLVTVNVTGTSANTEGPLFKLQLQQEGSKVKGSVVRWSDSGTTISGEIEGGVSGDVFRFHQTSGQLSSDGEFTVDGDDMRGTLFLSDGARRLRSLRRIDSSRPSSQ